MKKYSFALETFCLLIISTLGFSGCSKNQSTSNIPGDFGTNSSPLSTNVTNSTPTVRIKLGDVSFADSDFRKCVLDINTVDMYADEVTRVDCRDNQYSKYNVQSISGIEYLVNLTSFDLVLGDLYHQPINPAELDLSPMSSLSHLTHVGLGGLAIHRLDALRSLTSLTNIGIWTTSVSDLTPIASLPGIFAMGLTGNTLLTDLTPLKNLPPLRSLIIPSVNSLLTQVGTITQLGYLTIQTDNFLINDYPPNLHLISNLIHLIQLHIDHLNIHDLSGLETLSSLQFLHLEFDYVTNLTPIQNLHLQYLDASYNSIVDLSPLQNMTTLQSLNLEGNFVTSTIPLQNVTSLANVYLAYNQLQDVVGLIPLPNLSNVQLYNNNLIPCGQLDLLVQNHPLASISRPETCQMSSGPEEPPVDPRRTDG